MIDAISSPQACESHRPRCPSGWTSSASFTRIAPSSSLATCVTASQPGFGPILQDLVAYDLYCEFVAFNKGELLSELAKGEVMMDPQNVLRSDWPVWHKAVQHSCGGNSFYFVPDEYESRSVIPSAKSNSLRYIDRMIAGGQLKQMAGKRARVLLIPSLTEILRAVRSGDTKCVAYINRLGNNVQPKSFLICRLLKRTFRLTKLAEDAGEGVNLSVFWLLSPLVDDCDKGVRDRYSGLLNSENALRMAK